METLLQDLRYAARTLLKRRGFTAVAVVTLALGIGATTAIFSVVDGVLLRPLALPEPDRLVGVYASEGEERYESFVYSDWFDLRERATTLDGLAAYRAWEFALSAETGSTMIGGELVSAGYFDVLGIEPALGRFFSRAGESGDADEAAGAVAVIGHGLWQRRFGGSRDAVGRTLRLQGHDYTIVGVAPRGFGGITLTDASEVWLPFSNYGRVATGFLGTFDAVDYASQRSGRRIGLWHAVGRLRPGVGLAAAEGELRAIADRLAAAHPETNEGVSVTVVPAAAAATPIARRGETASFLLLLGGAVGLALLIACANLASLLLARATERGPEVSIRRALGATRGRLLRQFLTESALLALAGGAAGVIAAEWMLRLLTAYRLPGGVPIGHLDLSIDARMLAFAGLASLATAVLFGLAPALRATASDLAGALRHRADTAPRRVWLRDAMVAAQVGLCVVLLVGAGLFVRSMQRALDTELGFDPGNVLTATVDLGPLAYEEPRAIAFYDDVLARLAALPGVTSAAVSSRPFGDRGLGIGTVYPEGEESPIDVGRVTLTRTSPGYFGTIGMPLRRGAGFGPEHGAGAAPVAIVNETMARRLWPGRDPVGRRFNFSGPDGTFFTVVGVAADARYSALREEPQLHVYMPLPQDAGAAAGDAMTLLVRTAGDPLALAGSLRAAVGAVDPMVPVYDLTTMNERVAALLMPQRLGRALLGLFGALALALAAVGVYGLISHAVTARRREIGIRRALGALDRDVLRLVVARGAAPVGIGIAAGAVAALGASRAASAFLFEISPSDPAVYAAAAATLAVVGVVATLAPARRATAVRPMTVLRDE